jgi:hypothetical protein
VENAWLREAVLNGREVAGAVKGVLGDLSVWSRNVLGDLEKRLSRAKRELEKCRKKDISPDQVRKEEVLRFKLSRLEEQKELYWKQRAHVNWMKGGDRNTKFFHSAAMERKKMNHIRTLKTEDGGVAEAEEAKRDVAIDYFPQLFTSCAGTRVEELMENVDARVTPLMNEMLCSELLLRK